MKPGLDASMEYFSSGATESEEDPLQAGDKMVVINSPKEFEDVTSEALAVVDCEWWWLGQFLLMFSQHFVAGTWCLVVVVAVLVWCFCTFRKGCMPLALIPDSLCPFDRELNSGGRFDPRSRPSQWKTHIVVAALPQRVFFSSLSC